MRTEEWKSWAIGHCLRDGNTNHLLMLRDVCRRVLPVNLPWFLCIVWRHILYRGVCEWVIGHIVHLCKAIYYWAAWRKTFPVCPRAAGSQYDMKKPRTLGTVPETSVRRLRLWIWQKKFVPKGCSYRMHWVWDPQQRCILLWFCVTFIICPWFDDAAAGKRAERQNAQSAHWATHRRKWALHSFSGASFRPRIGQLGQLGSLFEQLSKLFTPMLGRSLTVLTHAYPLSSFCRSFGLLQKNKQNKTWPLGPKRWTMRCGRRETSVKFQCRSYIMHASGNGKKARHDRDADVSWNAKQHHHHYHHHHHHYFFISTIVIIIIISLYHHLCSQGTSSCAAAALVPCLKL